MFHFDEDYSNNSFEVLGLGSPIIDQLFQVEEEFLINVEGEKGGSMAVDISTLNKICQLTKQEVVPLPGGSAANTIVGLARLGTKCSLVGMVGKDEMGLQYRERMQKLNVQSLFVNSESQPTARLVGLVTPDGQRTMRTYLGASCEMRSQHLHSSFFRGIKLLHCEGYSLYNGNGELTIQAMKLASEQGACVSIDLASFELVRKYRTLIDELLEKYVDIVFCNEDEAKEFHLPSIEHVCTHLASLCKVAVVMMGAKGCYVQQGNARIFVPTIPVKCLDATGAGDIFAAGFLHRYLLGYSLKECCELGHLLGGEIVQVFGAQLPEARWTTILANLQKKHTSSIIYQESTQSSPFKKDSAPTKSKTIETDEFYSIFQLSRSF